MTTDSEDLSRKQWNAFMEKMTQGLESPNDQPSSTVASLALVQIFSDFASTYADKWPEKRNETQDIDSSWSDINKRAIDFRGYLQDLPSDLVNVMFCHSSCHSSFKGRSRR